MPTPSSLSIQQFLDNYNTYTNYSNNAIQWLQSINSISKALQADPNFATVLTLDEQQGVLANMSGSAQSPILPVGPNPKPVPPPPPFTPTPPPPTPTPTPDPGPGPGIS